MATRWLKNFEDIFIRFGATHEPDRQTDRHRMPAIAALMHSIAPQKLQTNRQSYSNTVIGTLAVDVWAVAFGTATAAPPKTLFAVPNVTVHPSTASIYQRHIIRCGTLIPLHSKRLTERCANVSAVTVNNLIIEFAARPSATFCGF